MSFFDRFASSNRNVPPLELTIDRKFGDPVAVAVTAAMAARDRPAGRRIIEAGHPREDFDFLVGEAARVAGSEEWLPDRIREDGDDTLARLVFGFRLVIWAWEARSDALAQDGDRRAPGAFSRAASAGRGGAAGGRAPRPGQCRGDEHPWDWVKGGAEAGYRRMHRKAYANS
jgi:hypothetical protein